MLLAGFEPAFPEFERLETYALDRTATEMALALYACTITPAFIAASTVVYYTRILFFFIAKGFITPLHDIKYQEVRWLCQKFHKGSKVMESSVPVNGSDVDLW